MNNWHKTPNYIYDAYSDMKEAELRLTIWLVRHTYGFHRGNVQATSKEIQEKTGLSKQGLINAQNAVQERGFFVRVSGGYEVNEVDEKVNEVDQKPVNEGQRSRPSRSTKLTSEVNEVDQIGQLSRPSTSSPKESIKDNIKEKERESVHTPKNLQGFNAMWGTGDNHLSTEQRAIKSELVNTIKGLVRDPRSVVNINEAADAVLELGVTADDLKKWYSPGGWWFTQGLGKKDNCKPYARNIFTSIDEAYSHSRPVNLTPVKLTPAAIMAQLSGLNGLKNGAKTAAWEAIPQDIRRVAILAVKVARDSGEPIYSVGDLLEAHLERVMEA